MFLFGIGPNGGNGPIEVFVPVPIGAMREAHSAATARKGKKRKARGRKERKAPRNELRYLTEFLKRRAERRSLKCFSLRAEEDTEPRK